MTEGVLVYRDLPVVVILLCNDGVVPDEVRPVPGDVVAWTQGRRIVDGLVAAECAKYSGTAGTRTEVVL